MRLPSSLQQRLDLAVSGLLNAPGTQRVDFCSPPREEALLAPDSVSWRIFKNPIALFVGGVAGVILELADPSVRTGVWEHSTFRSDPMRISYQAMGSATGFPTIRWSEVSRVIIRTECRPPEHRFGLLTHPTISRGERHAISDIYSQTTYAAGTLLEEAMHGRRSALRAPRWFECTQIQAHWKRFGPGGIQLRSHR